MQTYDDLDILALAWMAMFLAIIIVMAIIASYFESLGKKVLPPPQRMATRNHKRWYCVTTARLNDRRPNGGTRGDF